MRQIFAPFAMLVAGCATTTAGPSSTHQSAKSRVEVVDCILNRFDGGRPIVEAGEGSTVIRFVGPLGNSHLITTTADQGAGSITEIRGGNQISTVGVTNLVTCF